MANISLSHDKVKAMKFLKDAMKKTLKKIILKVARKGKAPSNEMPEDISVGVNKGSKANFLGMD